MSRALLLAGIAPLFFQLSPAEAKPKPTTVAVGTCKPSLVSFSSITQALGDVPAGSIIDICPGVYNEQLTITQSVTLLGVSDANSSAPTILPPAGGLVVNYTPPTPPGQPAPTPYAAQVAAINAGTVKIANLTVDGTNNQISECGPILIGVLFESTAGAIQNNQVVNQSLAPQSSLGGCQSGNAIVAESFDNGTYGVTITGNQVTNFQKNGITADGPGLAFTISGNTVVGEGATPLIAQNGIQAGPGGSGSVTGNAVSDEVYTGPMYGATGILVYDVPMTMINTNTVTNTQGGVFDYVDVSGSTYAATISKNIVATTHTFDGIDVCGTNGSNITSNTINGSDESAIHIDGECPVATTNTSINSNKVNGACAAILVGANTFSGTMSANSLLNADLLVSTGTDSCSGVAPQSPAHKRGAEQQRRPSPKL